MDVNKLEFNLTDEFESQLMANKISCFTYNRGVEQNDEGVDVKFELKGSKFAMTVALRYDQSAQTVALRLLDSEGDNPEEKFESIKHVAESEDANLKSFFQ